MSTTGGSRAPTQGDRITQLEETIARMEEQLRRTALLSPAPTAPAVRPSKPKIAALEYFHGHRTKLTTFLTQVSMVIKLQPNRYPTERSKVLYTASFLRDTAFLWFQPNLEKDPEPEMMTSYKKFCRALRDTFGDPDAEATAERNIFSLRQKGLASSYISEYQCNSTLTQWNDHALAAQSTEDSKKDSTMRLLIARVERPHTLKEMMDTALRIDNRLYERSLERGSETQFTSTTTISTRSFGGNKSYSNNNNFTPRSSPSTGTTTSTTYTRQSFPSRNDRPSSSLPINNRGKLTIEEYQRRKDQDLCLYCGAKDHPVAKCPLAKPNSSAGNSAILTRANQSKGQALRTQNATA
jgi:hypothetical protein